jgi:hypothetical protein
MKMIDRVLTSRHLSDANKFAAASLDSDFCAENAELDREFAPLDSESWPEWGSAMGGTSDR